jgi:uncharacterized membrane protein
MPKSGLTWGFYPSTHHQHFQGEKLMVSKKTLNTLLASAVVLTMGVATSASAEDTAAAATDKEKCYGVVKAASNDCASASGSHSCAGHAATDGDGGEWIALPAGVCSKLVNGSLEPVAAAAPAAEAAPAEAEAAADAPAADDGHGH